MSVWSALIVRGAVNAVLPFVVALGLVMLAVRAARLRPGRLRLALLLLPFAKLLWDAGQGAPAHSFVWAHLDGVVRDSGQFNIGLGVASPFGLRLVAMLAANVGDARYGLSLGDIAVANIDRLGSWVLVGCAACVVLVAIVRLAQLARTTWEMRRVGQRIRREAVPWRRVRVGWRHVDVFVLPTSSRLPAIPFTAGVFSPFVGIPQTTYDALGPREREAVLAHELAHVRHHHLALLVSLDIVRRLFWFVPGARWLTKRIADECELIADDDASRAVDGVTLASALLTVGERMTQLKSVAAPALHAASSKPLLAHRVERLIATGEALKLRWRLLQAAVVWATVQTVWMLVVGNHL